MNLHHLISLLYSQIYDSKAVKTLIAFCLLQIFCRHYLCEMFIIIDAHFDFSTFERHHIYMYIVWTKIRNKIVVWKLINVCTCCVWLLSLFTNEGLVCYFSYATNLTDYGRKIHRSNSLLLWQNNENSVISKLNSNAKKKSNFHRKQQKLIILQVKKNKTKKTKATSFMYNVRSIRNSITMLTYDLIFELLGTWFFVLFRKSLCESIFFLFFIFSVFQFVTQKQSISSLLKCYFFTREDRLF